MKLGRLLFTLAGCLATCCALARAAEPRGETVDGATFTGTFAGIDSGGKLLFTSSGQRSVPIDRLAWWGACGDVRKGPAALLADGGVLRGDIDDCDGKSLQLQSESFGAVKVPYDALAGAVFHPPASAIDRDMLFDRVAQARGDGDRLILDNGDEIAGRLESMTAEKIRIKGRLGAMDVAVPRVLALVADPSLRRTPPPPTGRCWLGLADGSRILVADLKSQGDSIALSTSLGQSWKTDRDDVTFLMPLGSKLKYLSDVTPSEYHFLPFLDIEWPYSIDRSVTGSMLRAGGRLYLKGIGVHSAARLSYLLDKPWRQFQADIAIDDSTGGRGSVRFRVFVDGKAKFASGAVRGGLPPVPVRVDLAGARRLDLVVDYGEAGDVLDRADWLNARLTP